MEEDYLETTCPFCNGTCEVINPKFLEWDLNGWNGDEPEPTTTCPICSGSGTIPTHTGIDILELVERYENVDEDSEFQDGYDDEITDDEDEEEE
jgi:hypothetical protein